MPDKRWLVSKTAPAAHLARYEGIHPLTAQVLYARGYDDAAAGLAFLAGQGVESGRFFHYRVRKPIFDAVSRIRAAIRAREKVVVYGDFDADGVTSTALLVTTLRALGADADAYIPNRVDEGYGVNSDALAKLRKDGVRLIITVDCGIRSLTEAELWKQFGLDMIITDHHTPGDVLPDALAVINPKLRSATYSEDMLAGVGVAFRLAEVLLWHAAANRHPAAVTSESLLDLVAIGTVADLAPLDRRENRSLVARGLAQMNANPRPGIRALLDVARVKPGTVTAETIGFQIGPRINAAGRLDSAMKAYELLMTENLGRAQALAEELEHLNTERQDLTRRAVDLIRTELEQRGATGGHLIVGGSEHIRPGVVGLVAGRLTEEFYRPSIVMEYGETETRASCRSIPEFDITRALDQCADLLVRHGGHAQAAGFTVLNENRDILIEKLTWLASNALDGQPLVPVLEADAEIDLNRRPCALSLELVADLARLQPTGHRFRTPVFVSRSVRTAADARVMKERHIKVMVETGLAEGAVEAVGFNMTHCVPLEGECVDLIYTIGINDFKVDKPALSLQLLDIAPAGTRTIDYR
jgi:single-stranded-DNA-specific exonuclease